MTLAVDWAIKSQHNHNHKGQGHSLTLVQGCSDSSFSCFFSLETATPIEVKFHVEPPWDGGMKVRSNGLCLMTKMVKTFKHLNWNQKANDLETWYAALVTRELPSSFK